MTQLQKEIIEVLFAGGSISKVGDQYRLRDASVNPIKKFGFNTMFQIKKLCRVHKGVFVLNKTKVRQLHGKSWVKQFYKSQTKK